MEVNEENLNRMVECLNQTLSPDPNLRKPGKFFNFCKLELSISSF